MAPPYSTVDRAGQGRVVGGAAPLIDKCVAFNSWNHRHEKESTVSGIGRPGHAQRYFQRESPSSCIAYNGHKCIHEPFLNKVTIYTVCEMQLSALMDLW